MTSSDISNQVRSILAQHARLPVDVAALSDTADLYANGLTSQASVTLMLALEGAFDVEFPDALLNRKTFESVAAISGVIAQLKAGA